MSAVVLVPDTETGDLFGGPSVAPLEAVAAQINQAHADAQAYASKAVERALVAGDLLNTVKAQLKHGEFLPWCKEHCPAISQRTIQDYTRVARELPIEMRSAAHLSLREALRTLTADRQLLKIPDEHAGWYDIAADAVWSKTSHALAFRFSVFDPDVKKALTADQILPLATAVRDELEQAEQATGQECLTDAGIRAAVRRQFQPVLNAHQDETKQAERDDPALRLNTLVRNGLTALEQSKSALNQITMLAEQGAITDPNFGAMGDRFYRATQAVKQALEEFPGATKEKVIRESILESPISNEDSESPAPADLDQELESHLKELPRGWGKTKDAIRKTYRTAQKTQAATIRAALEDEYRPMLERERAGIQAQRDELTALRKEAQADRDKARAMLQGITPMMTQDEFRLVRGLLHPDRHPDEAEKYGRALTIFNRLEAGINPNIPIAVLRKQGWGKVK